MSFAVTPRQVTIGVGVIAGGISALAANRDVKDGQPDSINGYVGYGLLASIGVESLGSVIGGNLGRGIATADVFGGVIAGGIIGLAIGNATKD